MPRTKSLASCVRLLVACALLMAPCAPSARGDGVVRDGLGAISAGRGGTNLAHADNGQILLDNPAGMINLPGRGISEVSGDFLLTDLGYSDAENNGVGEVNRLFPLPQISWMTKSSDGLWAVGLGAYAPAGFGAEFALEGPPALPGPRRYMSLGALGKILPGVACKLTDQWAVGGTFGLALSHAELEGPFFLQTGPLAGTPTVMDLQGTGAAIAWSFGSQYLLSEQTTLGIAYQSETRFHLDGRAAAFVPGLGESDFDAKIDIAWPQSLGLGFQHRFCPHRRFSADVIWFDWSGSFDSFGLRLTDPSNPTFAAMLGDSVQDRFPLNWDDSVSLRVGYEWDLSACTVMRAGYAYHRNQIPESTLTSFIPAILEHAFSLGCGHDWGRCRFDLAYQYSFGRDREVATSSLAGGDFDNSTVEAQAHWLFLSVLRQH